MTSENDFESSQPTPGNRIEAEPPEFDAELEELCLAQNRNAAAAALLRLLLPGLLIVLLIGTAVFAYLQFKTTRDSVRAKIDGNPHRAMEMLLNAVDEDAKSKGLLPMGSQFDQVEEALSERPKVGEK